MSNLDEGQRDLFSAVADLDLVRLLIADLHDDLAGRVTRFRLLRDLGSELGAQGTMIPGGQAAFLGWMEARSSFVQGNFIATVQLCQGLLEHALAAYFRLGLNGEDLPPRVSFRSTLDRCKARNILSDAETADLDKLMVLRNRLSHFRDLSDSSDIDRRAMQSGDHPDELLRRDARFAIGVATRILAKPQFRLG
jgi:hypothetical protein